ncbi:hypothetical protein [Actinomadura napierensis]
MEVVVAALAASEIEEAIREYQVRLPDGRITTQYRCFGLGPEYVNLLQWLTQPRLFADVVCYIARTRQAAHGKNSIDVLDLLDTDQARVAIDTLRTKGLIKVADIPDPTEPDRLSVTAIVCATRSATAHPENGNTNYAAAAQNRERFGLTEAHRQVLVQCAKPKAVVELVAEVGDHSAHRLILDLLNWELVEQLDADLYNPRLYRELLAELRRMGVDAPSTTSRAPRPRRRAKSVLRLR